MKRILLFAMCLLLGVFPLAGCSDSSEPFVEKQYTVDREEITEIRMDVRDREVQVLPSADSSIHIQYFENAKEYYNISISDCVLTMGTESGKTWTDYVGGKAGTDFRTILLQIPESLLTELHISTTNENISLSPLTVTDEVSLSSNGGNIVFEELNAGNAVTLHVKNGDISGSLVGSDEDYAILCTVKKGESNLPDRKSEGEKTLQVSVNHGDVNMAFVS